MKLAVYELHNTFFLVTNLILGSASITKIRKPLQKIWKRHWNLKEHNWLEEQCIPDAFFDRISFVCF